MEPEVLPQNESLEKVRKNLDTLKQEVENMKSDGISETEKEVIKKRISNLKNEITWNIGTGPHELYAELIGIIDDVKKNRQNTGIGIEKNISKIPKKTQDFFYTLNQTGDPVLLKIWWDLQRHFVSLSPEQRAVLDTCTPQIHLIGPQAGKILKESYGIPAKDWFGIFIKKSDSGQLAYLVNGDGMPVLSFTVSLWPSTPRYNGTIRNPGNRTRLFEKLGQTYKNWAKQWTIDWDNEKALMTTAILALQTEWSYYLHGTNKENNLGNNTSHGCVRFDNVSIAFLSKVYENDSENFYVTIEK